MFFNSKYPNFHNTYFIKVIILFATAIHEGTLSSIVQLHHITGWQQKNGPLNIEISYVKGSIHLLLPCSTNYGPEFKQNSMANAFKNH